MILYLNKIILVGIIVGVIIIGVIAVSGMSNNSQVIESEEEGIDIVVETPPQGSKQFSLDLNERVVLGDK